ncbi:MAG: hypothetical protein WAV90_03695 [Gordonia amarae]
MKTTGTLASIAVQTAAGQALARSGQAMTACVVNTLPTSGASTLRVPHGFVLGPNDSSTF